LKNFTFFMIVFINYTPNFYEEDEIKKSAG